MQQVNVPIAKFDEPNFAIGTLARMDGAAMSKIPEPALDLMEIASAADLFERNMAALRAQFPIVYLHVAKIAAASSQITGSIDGGDLNLDLGHALLYTPDAQSYAETQLDRFRASPTRFYLNRPALRQPPEQQQDHITAALYEYGRARPVADQPARPADGGGFMLVYGIGLGCHLPTLFDEADVRNFILIEEHIEFLYQALHLHDWSAILARLTERGQTLRFIFGAEPRTVAAQVHWYMRGQGFGLIDGSYIFRHYTSMMLDKAYDQFAESIHLLSISIGFFEDEMQMLLNCGANLTWFDYLLLDERKRVEIDLPALVIGSGPSLDKSLEAIRALQDKAILFSCGSALRPLLQAGIRPDFHCELENSATAFDSIQQVATDLGVDFDGITLIASNTVWGPSLALFKERILYFRDSVSSTALWCPDQTGIYGTAPTCTNLALRAATLLCFKALYLFGVDLGTRDPTQHHSRASVYYTDKKWAGVLEAELPNRMTIELPANFGGKAYTSQILHWARMMMGQGIEAFSFSKIFNCSDGVIIPRTIPQLPATIRATAPAGRKQMVLTRIHRDLERKTAREMIPLNQLQAARAAFRDYYDDLLALIDRMLVDGAGFIDFYDAAAPFLRDKSENRFQTALRAVNVGFLMMSFQIAYYFVRRVPDAEQVSVTAVYLKALAGRLMEMQITVERVFAWLEQAQAAERSAYVGPGREYPV
jgi:Glycosyltransferase Maf N-terminal domain/Protein of unknown function DUF115